MSEPPPSRCLNCATPAPGRYCPSCGQGTRELRAPFRTLVRELLDHLSFDTAMPRSLACLLFQPGRLTEGYLAGQRARYVSPLRMYLIVSLVFSVLFVITPPDVTHIDVYVGGELIGPAQPPSEDGPQIRSAIQIMNPEGSSWLGERIEELLLSGQRERFEQMDPQALVDAAFRGLQRHLKLALFVFLPLLALALRVLFLRSGSLYFDHLIFALHFQSFLFLALSIAWPFPGFWAYVVTVVGVVPLYLLVALRRVYRQPWPWIVVKSVALGLAYVALLAFVFHGVIILVLRSV